MSPNTSPQFEGEALVTVSKPKSIKQRTPALLAIT